MAPASLLKTLEALSKQPSPGPAPAFSYVDLCRALLLIGDDGPIGRIELSRRLMLGEGATRTIIRHLTQAKMISIIPNGCKLTKYGAEIYAKIRTRLSKPALVDARQLSLDRFSVALSIRRAAQTVRRGIEQRDAAVRAGATGACTLVRRRGRYVMPMSESDRSKLELDDALVRDLELLLHPRDGDATVMVSASKKNLAEQGAYAAALTLLK